MQDAHIHTEIVTQLHEQAFVDQLNSIVCDIKLCQASASTNIIDRCMQHIQNMLHMYHDIGYEQLLLLYNTISQRPDNDFAVVKGWRTCLVSGLACNNCLAVAPTLFVAPTYSCWMHSVWLITHMHTFHKLRKSQNLSPESKLEDDQVDVYRRSFLCVLNDLHAAFPTMLLRAKMMSLKQDH